ncbi:MAG: carboxypeptidase-like regulatory domain-containing protein [Roseivirga sp.]|nr:carboxypeptidase-like regulatory domain-containing protein [Roseivirga sp.]
MRQLLIATLLILIGAISVCAQGIRGTIKSDGGEILPFASIYVKETGSGTSSNLDGFYELRLNPGQYEITFQFMGYETRVVNVEVNSQFTSLNIEMKTQVIALGTVIVTGKQEDPSYTIMRKAITKAKYHLLQFDEYSARVYMKGTGQITKIPWLFRKTMAKEGIDTSSVFTSESVSEISFQRPNTFNEKVLSVRTSGEGNDNADPASFISSSFYLPKVDNSISPLSPRAFSYYKFTYLGSFKDRGYEINKIMVTPRSRGDNLFEGEIYIREDFWNIHSLDLTTGIMGFMLRIQQIFAPIEGEIWMPVTQRYDFSGSILGFGGSYNYLASVSDYQVTKNQDLDASVILVDEKIEEAPEEIEAIKEGELDEGMKEVFEEDKGVSRKQFRKLMKEYEKQEQQQLEEPDLISIRTYKFDSLAYKKDSLYWAQIRPVPLTEKEIKGYKKADSTYIAEKEKADADSSRLNNGERFKPMQLLTGSYYRLGERLRFDYDGILETIRFNTVEGWNADLGGTFLWRNDTTTRLRITPNVRYGLTGGELYYRLQSVFGAGRGEARSTFRVSGGHYISQYHPGSVDDFINTAYTLIYEKNFMKLYEKDYLRFSWSRRFNYRFDLGAATEWASRTELFNSTGYSLFNNEGRTFRRNAPFNEEVAVGNFVKNKALIATLNLKVSPWIKLRSYNGRIRTVNNNAPTFRLSYKKGIAGLLNSEVQFDQLEIGSEFDFEIGVRATIDFDVTAGSFFGNPDLEFMDFKHFPGNRLEFAPLNVTGGYRLLDYYQNSTSQEYLSVFSHIRFRKFLFTQLPMFRFSGLKENLFVNYLSTPTSDNYTELGYTIDNIFRVFRLEFIQSFRGWKAAEFGVRIGVAAVFGDD